MTFILDTSFLFALRERKDKYHLRALNIFKSLEGLDKINLITNIFTILKQILFFILKPKPYKHGH